MLARRTALSLLPARQACRPLLLLGAGSTHHPPSSTPLQITRHKSLGSSQRWKARQGSDPFAREAKVQGLKSRAAFKILQIHDQYRIFHKNGTVVDLGFAPGSWSQVAANCTGPLGRVVGVDLLPAQPPRGVSTIQGDFLAPSIQAEVRAYVLDHDRGRPRQKTVFRSEEGDGEEGEKEVADMSAEEAKAAAGTGHGYLEMERATSEPEESKSPKSPIPDDSSWKPGRRKASRAKKQSDAEQGRVVDTVLSDMSEPWDQTTGFGKKSISNAYNRMMNTTGVSFKDHVGSMDLCTAALSFCYDTLREGGNFVCKFYQGAEDKLLEKRIRRLFQHAYRMKPEASRSESREGFFVALKRKDAPTKEEVFAE